MQWSSITAVSHLVAVGAGAGDVLAQCITCKPANTLVYEADAAQAQLLAGEYQQSAAFTVKPLAVAATATTGQLHRFNLPQCNALAVATGELQAIFPGLQALPPKELQTVELAAELASAGIQGQNNMLLLELPAQNLSLLQHLADKQLLAHFSHLVLQHSEQVLYQGGATLAQLQQFLTEQGFEQQELDTSDVDFPLIRFYRDAKAELLKQTQQQLQQAEHALAQLSEQLQTATQQAELQKLDLAKQLDAAKQQAEQQKAELAKQVEAAKQQADQQKIELAKQTEAAKQLDAAKQQVEQLKVELAKQTEAAKQLDAAKQQVELQKAELAKQAEAAKQLDAAKQQAEQQKAELAKQLEAAKLQVEQQKTELAKQAEAAKQLEAAKQQAEQQTAELAKQLETAKQQAEQQKAELTKQVDSFKQLQAQQTTAEALEQKMQQLFAAQSQELNKAVGNIKNHVNSVASNNAKQLEAFIGINNYLEHGIKPLNFHGWPISPDIGLYITGLIDANNYDVIIEFGSGTSTVMMAKALQAKQRGVSQKTLTDKRSKAIAIADEADYTDLPARIVTFEHNSKYHAQTLQALKDNGVEQLVDLVHAPLVDYQYKDGTQYLYYSCSEKLAEIAKVFKGRKANVLVLVDGPPGSTNKHARFPAMPHLLNSMGEHMFTVIMDDYNRTEEKEIVERWFNMSSERFMSPNLEEIPCEKGVAVLTVY